LLIKSVLVMILSLGSTSSLATVNLPSYKEPLQLLQRV
jgi:hypothetical protein